MEKWQLVNVEFRFQFDPYFSFEVLDRVTFTGDSNESAVRSHDYLRATRLFSRKVLRLLTVLYGGSCIRGVCN